MRKTFILLIIALICSVQAGAQEIDPDAHLEKADLHVYIRHGILEEEEINQVYCDYTFDREYDKEAIVPRGSGCTIAKDAQVWVGVFNSTTKAKINEIFLTFEVPVGTVPGPDALLSQLVTTLEPNQEVHITACNIYEGPPHFFEPYSNDYYMDSPRDDNFLYWIFWSINNNTLSYVNTNINSSSPLRSASASTDNRTWRGQAANNSWDLVTSNWTNPQSPLPLPTPFISGSNALFDDTAVRDTVSLVGAIEAGDVQFNNTTKNYVLKSSGSDAKLTGAGSLIKEGSGSLTLSVVNELTGGTVVKEGTVIQSSPTDISALGDSITLEGGIVRLGEKVNSDGSKYTFNKLVYIPAGRSGELFFNRYVNWENTSLSGDGELTIVVPGERVMFKKTVDISGYTNRNIIIEGSTAYDVPDKLFVIETDSTYNYETDTGKEEKFKYKTIQLRSGAGLATESSQTRRYVIGEITADDESCALYGYYKSSTSPVIEYEIGGLNTDVVFKGVIRTITISNGLPRTDNALGIIKVGTGTYKLTNGENFIGKGIDVKEGRIFISNPPDTRSGTGYARNRDAVIVYENGALGGTGRISGDVTVKGKLEPGEDGVGSLLIDDLKTVYDTLTVSTPKRYKLTFESTATAEMELATASGHDAVDVYEVAFGGKLAVKLASTYDLNAGDEFQLFKANNISGTFDAIELPNADTWTWDTSSLYADGKIKLTAGGGSGTDINQALINEIKLYPNPSSGSFEINAQGNIITGIQVFNPAGMTVYSDRPHSAQTVVNLTGAAKGIYIVKILSENQAIVRKVVIK